MPFAALAVLILSLVHLALARRLDLGPLVVAGAGVAWALDPVLTYAAAAVYTAAAWVAAFAWARGAAAGVGRPDLSGGLLAAAASVQLLPSFVPELLPALTAPVLTQGGVGVLALLGLVATGLAAQRKGLPGQRRYHYREVPVTAPTSPASDESP